MSYDTWTTKDGREIPVREMTDLHVVHTIRAIEEGRVFPTSSGPELRRRLSNDVFTNTVYSCEGSEFEDFESDDQPYELSTPTVRGKWLTVLKAEAIRRGLDWSKAPTSKVGIVDHVLRTLGEECGCDANTIARTVQNAREVLARLQIAQPEIDICNWDGKPSYLHWQAGNGIGTPLERS